MGWCPVASEGRRTTRGWSRFGPSSRKRTPRRSLNRRALRSWSGESGSRSTTTTPIAREGFIPKTLAETGAKKWFRLKGAGPKWKRLEPWWERPLSGEHHVIYLDGAFLSVRRGKGAKEPVYPALGIKPDGQREVLRFGSPEQKERASGDEGRS